VFHDEGSDATTFTTFRWKSFVKLLEKRLSLHQIDHITPAGLSQQDEAQQDFPDPHSILA